MSDITSDWPVVTDDDGSGQTGTVFNRTLTDSMKTAINNQVKSTSNPSVTPASIIDEVVTARGNKVSLSSRIGGVIDADGVLVVPATITTQAVAQSVVGTSNLVANDDFMLWASGDSSAPDLWTLSGAGAAVARTGTGLADTTRKVGDFCAKVTYGSAAARLTQALLNSTDFARADFLKSVKIGVGCWVYSATASIARIVVDDGVTQGQSSYHTGDSTWQWLTKVHTMSSTATKLDVYCEVAAAGSGYFSGFTGVISELAPAGWRPCPTRYDTLHIRIAGALAVTANIASVPVAGYGIVKDVQMRARTAPTGASILCMVGTSNGAGANNGMFTAGGRPAIADGANHGGSQPDTTYARRCVRPLYGNPGTLTAGGFVYLDIDQIGSGTAGSDLDVAIRVLFYERPLARFHSYNS